MQAPRPTMLTSVEKESIASDMRGMIESDQVRVQITYKSFVSETINVETGIPTRVTTDDTLYALFHDVTVEEVDRSGGILEMGDRVYQVMVEDLTNTPKTVDTVVEGSVTREVVHWERDTLGITYQIWVRGGGSQ